MSEHQKGVFAIIVVAVAFASMGIFVRFLDDSLQLFQQTYLRIGLATLIGVVVFRRYLNASRIYSAPVREWVIIIFRAVMLYGAVALFTAAILETKYANVSIVAMVPLMPLFGYFLLGEHMNIRKISYVFTGFVGVILVALNGIGTFSWGIGETYALFSALCFDMSYVARKWQSTHFNNKETTVLMLFMGGIFLFGLSVFIGEGVPSVSTLGIAALLSLLASAAFNVFHLYYSNYGFERISVTLAGQLLMLEVPVALIYGVLLYGEVPVLRELIGGALIVWSAWQMNRIA